MNERSEEHREEEYDPQVQSFTLILHAGNSKSSAMEAIAAANAGDFQKAEDKLKEADEELTVAHQTQTDLLVRMSRGESIPVDVLMVHAQDHLNAASIISTMAKQLTAVQKELAELKEKING
ncbi:MAG: PTS lactose/cellobiose transporter subunit IIA [Erysipelotrichaceae bacterium]|nr:PTS lactose/cellobiose transporter subunit IIA [Erysipelotrichaceae bacterium]